MTGLTSGNSHAPNDRSAQLRWFLKSRETPLILGHRGAPKVATENTLRAFDLALRQGADGVELDVRKSRDGGAVVVHDDSLERTMGCDALVSATDTPAIQRLTNGEVPTFEQSAAWAAAAGAWLNVEFKSRGVERAVLEVIESMELGARTIVSSFDEEVVATLASTSQTAPAFLLTEQWDSEARVRLSRSGAVGVCLGIEAADGTTLGDLADRGLPVIAWTVNEPAQIRRLIGAGVFAIITDRPDVAAAEVKRSR